MKRTLFILFALFGLLTTNGVKAQNSKEAKAVLDRTASIIKKSGNVEIQFSAASFMEQQEKGNISGTIYLKGQKFHIVSTNVLTWYDGKTMWSYSKDNNEVNVSVPTLHEKETMNPYLFIDLYKTGYSYSMTDTNLRGHDCNEIHLMATDKKKEVKEMILTIDKKSGLPMCVRLREGIKYWVRVSVLKCKVNQKYNDATFVFNRKDYPTADVIDIR